MFFIFAGTAGWETCMFFIFAGGDMYVLYFRGAGRPETCMFFIFAGTAGGETCMFFHFAERRDMYVFFDEQAKGCQFALFYKGSWRQISQKRTILT